jgi:hypothetical protein
MKAQQEVGLKRALAPGEEILLHRLPIFHRQVIVLAKGQRKRKKGTSICLLTRLVLKYLPLPIFSKITFAIAKVKEGRSLQLGRVQGVRDREREREGSNSEEECDQLVVADVMT